MKYFWIIFLLGAICSASNGRGYPPVQPGVVEHFGYGVQRTMSLLAASTPERRETVKILFYGQSITEQAWWRSVTNYLWMQFPEANLIVENRAIGGYGADLMVRAAESDLFPFYPDLVIFQVYGSLSAYESLIRNIRERTTSEILIQTDHVTLDEELAEETNPVNEEEMSANAFKNYVFLPRICDEYGAELADVRSGWKRYLEEYELPASALLRDHIHLNAHGEFVMGELVKPHLRHDAGFFRSGWQQVTRTYVVGKDIQWTKGVLEMEFAGNRVDLIFERGAAGAVTNYIDGLAPSEHAAAYVFTRSTPAEGSSRPALIGIESEAIPLVEEWTLTITNWNLGTRHVGFHVEGSQTGFDGAGSSAERFVSDSGRVVLEPAAWGGARLAWWTSPPTPGFEIKWGVVKMGKDVAEPAESVEPGLEDVVTILQGFPNGTHSLRLEGTGESLVRAVRIYNPAGMRVNRAPHITAARFGPEGMTLQVRGAGLFQLERTDGNPGDPESWTSAGLPMSGPEFPVMVDEETAFFRVRKVEY